MGFFQSNLIIFHWEKWGCAMRAGKNPGRRLLVASQLCPGVLVAWRVISLASRCAMLCASAMKKWLFAKIVGCRSCYLAHDFLTRPAGSA